MQTTENYGLKKPGLNEFYNVEDFNHNADVLDAKMKEIEDAANPQALKNHVENKENPHGVTKEQVGLSNVPNVKTTDQTPTYAVPESMAELTSGEKLTMAFGKIAKAVKAIIDHIGNGTIHVSGAEKNTWNAKADGIHKHSKDDISDFPSTMTPSAHNQSASTITAGTFQGAVVANANAVKNLGTKQMRNIYGGTEELEDGVSELPAGDIYVMFEEA